MKETISHLYWATKQIGEGKQEAYLENNKITSVNKNDKRNHNIRHCDILEDRICNLYCSWHNLAYC